MAQALVLLGTYVLAQELFDLISEIPGYEVTAFAENQDRTRCEQELEGRPVLWVDDLGPLVKTHLAMGALGTTHRRGFIEQVAGMGMGFATLVHPTARVSTRATLSEGCFVSAGCVIATKTHLEPHVFVNRGTLIGHHVHIGAYSSIQCGVNIGGNARLEEGAFVGMSAVVLDNITVGRQTIVGAGAVVTKDVPERVQVLGVPARVVKTEVQGR